MASSEPMGPGKHRAVWRDSSRKKCHSKAPYFPTAKEAERYAWEQEAKARRQASRDAGTLSPSISWREWSELWWANRVIELSTDRTERRVLEKELIPQWGEEPLNEIKRKVVQAWVDRLTLESSPNNAVRLYSIFRASMSAALEAEVLDASPCVKIKLPVIPPSKTEYFEEDEVEPLISAIKSAGKCYAEYCEVLLDTGMRPGELGGLHQVNIDFAGKFVYVKDVVVRGGREIKGIPKGKKNREVPLTSRSVEILQKWCDARPDKRNGCGQTHVYKRRPSRTPCKSELAFRQPNGAPFNEGNFYFIFQRALARAGLRPRQPYALRHTYATRLAEAGIDITELARLLGHSDLRMTMRYIHRTKAARARVLAALGDPEATGLRVVGHDQGSGTVVGTDERNGGTLHDTQSAG